MLQRIYRRMLIGDFKINDADISEINRIAEDFINSNSPNNLNEIDLIIRISNILYNNTDLSVLPLEDGVYDLVLEKYKKYNPHYEVGSASLPIKQMQKGHSHIESVASDLLVKYPETYINMPFSEAFYNQFVWEEYINDKIDDLPSDISKITNRARDVSHKYPELVGTLDKCKFVLDSQAKNAGVIDSPAVSIFERDFLVKNIYKYSLDIDNLRMALELKYDGISIEAECSNKVLSARTRGDLANDKAADLTDVFYGYKFPNDFKDEVFGVKFEAVITKHDMFNFAKETGKVYKNARTAISGILGSENARQYLKYITLVPLAISSKKFKFDTRSDELFFLNSYYATKIPNYFITVTGDIHQILGDVYCFTKTAEASKTFLPFMFDGVVASFNDRDIAEKIGRENFVNKWSTAIKFSPERRLTRFRGYEYTVGKTGSITPMATFDPIEFKGTVHTICSAHSLARFRQLSLKYNDIVEVTYENDVMPYIRKYECPENDANTEEVIKFIDRCPSCGSKLHGSVSGKMMFCLNPDCKAKLIARFTDTLAKLNFENVSAKTVEKLGIYDFSNFININDADAAKIFGEAGLYNFMQQLERLRTEPIMDYQIIGALGFPNLATGVWKKVLNKVSLDDIINLQDHILKNNLMMINGIGEIAANIITSERKNFMDDLKTISMMPNIVYSISANKSLVVRFSGVRDRQLERELYKLGYDIGEGAVTKNTDILVVPYIGYSSSKTEKAKAYGIKIMPIDYFESMALSNEL